MTINGVACGLKSVDGDRIRFVAPLALGSAATGTSYPVVINANGSVLKTKMVIVPVRPDVFNEALFIGPGGRAKLLNVTNRVYTKEPYVTRTIRRRGDVLRPSVLRLYVTGVANVDPAAISIRIRDSIITASNVLSNVIVEPGVYIVDFELPATLDGAGDQPLVVTISVNGITFSSRLDDTSTKVLIL